MPENLPRDMKNKYYLLRHGQSTANVDEIISSARSLAYTNKHGLTSVGYDQGFDSASSLIELLKESTEKGDRVVLVSSPLARARETAEACLDGLFQNETNAKLWRDELGVAVAKNIYYHDLLVERNFGRLDGEGKFCVVFSTRWFHIPALMCTILDPSNLYLCIRLAARSNECNTHCV
jgi:broad specificity phosphatase PhoE